MHSWAVSVLRFLLSCPVAVIVGRAAVWYGRRWAGRTTPVEPPSTVTFLAGGTDRVVDAAVARFVQFGENRKDALSAPDDPASDHPIDRDVHQHPAKVHALRRRLKVMPRERALAEHTSTGCRACRSRSAWSAWSTTPPSTATRSVTSWPAWRSSRRSPSWSGRFPPVTLAALRR
ncbi:hypothetical protein [Actinomadura rugatobispora]|uniref:Uncharacterized protein n=1 Tax=Actinomadura rugatobispora TaxID=1994 RepID=A0ABW0ZV07_9ACTN|nr:hypothetical protein GCM10010200_034420 [Actinomadura rugatobispora]